MSAPVYTVTRNASSTHQISPTWVIAFWPYQEPRVGMGTDANKLLVYPAIIVQNDAISVTVTRTKQDHIKTANIQLKITDTQYDQLLRSSDHVAIWMTNWPDDAASIVAALSGQQSNLSPNSFMSGLKFIGRVKTVSKNLSVSDDGVPNEVIVVNATMFNELNLSVYMSRLYDSFTTAEAGQTPDQTTQDLLFLQYLDPTAFENFIATKANSGNFLNTPDEVIFYFASVFLGKGPHAVDFGKEFTTIPDNIGNKIVVPSQVYSAVFGQSASNRYIDNIYIFSGIESYAQSGSANTNPSLLLPSNTQQIDSFYKSPSLKGGVAITAPPNDNIDLFTLFQNFLNDLCNEIYTTMRWTQNGGIRPTLVARQIPLSTPQLDVILQRNPKINRPKGTDGALTQFNNIPRWTVDSGLIKSVNVGYGTDTHINMVHIITTPFWLNFSGYNDDEKAAVQQSLENLQIQLGSLIYDQKDIVKNGLRSFIKETYFESINFGKKGTKLEESFSSPFWTAMQADFLFNMNLKLSGQVSCFGIQEPICEGDNFQFDGIVYHIEAIEHMCQIFPSGKKFRTILTLSNGVVAAALENSTDQAFLNFYPAVNIPHTYQTFGLTELQNTLNGVPAGTPSTALGSLINNITKLGNIG